MYAKDCPSIYNTQSCKRCQKLYISTVWSSLRDQLALTTVILCCVLYTVNTSYCEGDSVSGDASVRRLANVEPDCCCLCASKICVSAFMKGVISCRVHKDIIHGLSIFARNVVARCVPWLIMIPDPPENI